MTALAPFLLFCQALGAAVGAFTALWGEFAYLRAMKDGKIDVAERKHLDAVAHGLRFGMVLVLLSSLGLVVLSYQAHTPSQPAFTGAYWALIMLSVLIIGVTWALSRQHLSPLLGSATIFTCWWVLAYLTVGWLSPISFFASVTLLIIAIGVMYGIIRYLRLVATRSPAK